jgi:heme/copper-type cytochrome/quinol oxidase subunit 3
MSSVATTPHREAIPLSVVDHRRGTQAMVMFIITEAMLFLMFFFAYYYLGHDASRWPTELPKLPKALIMLAILLSSSGVLYVGEEAGKKGQFGRAKFWTGITVLMGIVFLGIQALEYREHLRTLRPTTNAYGSIFYTITSFHAAHVMLGLLMLAYVLILPAPHVGKAEKPPHHGLHNAALYWHFVDVVWLFIVGLLYVAPHVTGQ